jgi:hypothetical protein
MTLAAAAALIVLAGSSTPSQAAVRPECRNALQAIANAIKSCPANCDKINCAAIRRPRVRQRCEQRWKPNCHRACSQLHAHINKLKNLRPEEVRAFLQRVRGALAQCNTDPRCRDALRYIMGAIANAVRYCTHR